jgi:transposase
MHQLKVNQQQTIVALHQQGWSKRKIARELGVDRITVRKYLAAEASNSPTPQAGSADSEGSISPANPQTGSDPNFGSNSPTNLQTGVVHLGGSGPESLCEPWKERIEKALVAGLSVQRIYQDLVAEESFDGSYYSVRRFALRQGATQELPFRRMEVEPAAEAQVDLGQGAWVVENGKRRRPHLFRVVLSHSRKGYSEVVWHQTSESFIRCLENAFRSFGGVSRTLVVDYVARHIIDVMFPPAICALRHPNARYSGESTLRQGT